MKILVLRYSESYLNGGSTLGLLFVDGVFVCYTLEDEGRDVKVPGETRIPAGEYPVILRTWGPKNERYAKRFPEIHKGMLEIAGVPGFTDILIHLGNTEKDTAGCLLVGDTVNNNVDEPAYLGMSTQAYFRLYPKVLKAITTHERVAITLKDIGEGVKT